jgi:hypothetical protein
MKKGKNLFIVECYLVYVDKNDRSIKPPFYNAHSDTVIPCIYEKLVPEPLLDTEILKCSSPLFKMAWYLRMTHAHPPVHT